MATFDELMEKFRNPGEEGLPENFVDELETVYKDDLSVRDAAVTERQNRLEETQKEIEARDKEVLRLKGVIYDSMVAAPKAGEPDNENEPDGNDQPRGVDSLFE